MGSWALIYNQKQKAEAYNKQAKKRVREKGSEDSEQTSEETQYSPFAGAD